MINRARGTYTELPEAGDRVGCGDVLYRVDERPVLLLCGTVPAYRDLHIGDEGTDVRQLNRNLRRLGYHVGTAVAFTWRTRRALRTSAPRIVDFSRLTKGGTGDGRSQEHDCRRGRRSAAQPGGR